MTSEIGIQTQPQVEYGQEKKKSVVPGLAAGAVGGVAGYYSPWGLQKAKYNSVEDIINEYTSKDKFEVVDKVDEKIGEAIKKAGLDDAEANKYKGVTDAIKAEVNAQDDLIKKLATEKENKEAIANLVKEEKITQEILTNADDIKNVEIDGKKFNLEFLVDKDNKLKDNLEEFVNGEIEKSKNELETAKNDFKKNVADKAKTHYDDAKDVMKKFKSPNKWVNAGIAAAALLGLGYLFTPKTNNQG